MITNKIKTKGMIEHISYNSKCKFNSTVCNSNQKWINKTYQYEPKSYLTCKRDYSWNRSTCTFENLKSILLTQCDETYIYHGYCINKKDKYYEYCFDKLPQYKSKKKFVLTIVGAIISMI